MRAILFCAGEKMVVISESNREQLLAHWYTLAEVTAAGLPLFPEGLAALLEDELFGPDNEV